LMKPGKVLNKKLSSQSTSERTIYMRQNCRNMMKRKEEKRSSHCVGPLY